MIILKNLKEIDRIRKSCDILAQVLSKLYEEIKPGITTIYLNDLAETMCLDRGGLPGFKGYRGFPFSICASKNEEIVHGFPDSIPLKDGDIISIDFGVLFKGWYGDAAFTKGVGQISRPAQKIISIGKKCLEAGISEAKLNNRIGDVSNAVQRCAESEGYGVVRDFVGHGIGRNLHEDPSIPNYGSPHVGPLLKPGMVIAIEPMITEGDYKTITQNNGWTITTIDKKLSVHFEHTVVILEDGPQVLTKFN